MNVGFTFKLSRSLLVEKVVGDVAIEICHSSCLNDSRPEK